ncbi:MAG: N-acetylmannosamine-6-phosphate 2-epimerase [Anaerolineae bacterium]|nr:N-acetylmannosamine-6-phosphate 2-epimerase [Anaerolineae bacterium]
MPKQSLLNQLKHGLIVSCQPRSPMNGPLIVGAMAQAAVMAGAVGVRINGSADVAAARERVEVPIIGITKQRQPDYQVYITPTLEDALDLIRAGADIIAMDGTSSPRPTGISLQDLIAGVHARGALVMADVSTLEEGLNAARAGADIVAPTLSGYTPYSPQIPGPDLDLLAALVRELALPVIAEGRYHTPADMQKAFELGAFAVVVGRAITEMQDITRRFVEAIPN